MRFIGIIGIVFLITIAYLFSKDNKKINWTTVFWGLGLQVLFAIIILGNTTISFIGAGLLLSLMTVYVATTRIKTWLQMQYNYTISIYIVNLLCLMIIMLLPLTTGYIFSDIASYITILLWLIVLLVWIARNFISYEALQQTPINSCLIVIICSLGLGMNLATTVMTNGDQGTMAHNLQIISQGVGDFLTIPSRAGASMIFGSLAEIKEPWYFLFFVQVLPTIIFFSAFISILYYLGIVQILVAELARFMSWTMKTSGAETLSCSGNIFVGQTEAPILIKPFIKDMTKSEIHTVMTGGFATISGGVFAGFIAMGLDPVQLISASVMSAPAALMISKIFYPETEKSTTAGDIKIPKMQVSDNIIGVASQGTSDGLQLALNVGAMLLAFIALVKAIDMGLNLINDTWSLTAFFGYIFQYFAFILGVPIQDMVKVGSLLGNKIAINEFVAYSYLSDFIKNNELTYKSQVIATYALCGFANFGSIGIQIGGITPMAPERRSDIASLGFRAMWAGAFASWITAAIAGIFIG